MVCLIRHLVVQHLGRNPILVWRVRSGELISYIFIGAVGDELLGLPDGGCGLAIGGIRLIHMYLVASSTRRKNCHTPSVAL
jgi:hypothetical protein